MSNAIFMDSHLSAIISWFDVYLRIDIINVCSYKSKICKLYISGDLYIWRFGLKGTHSLQSEIYTARKKRENNRGKDEQQEKLLDLHNETQQKKDPHVYKSWVCEKFFLVFYLVKMTSIFLSHSERL